MSGKSRYLAAGDGLLARVSGPWAEAKLGALDRYNATVNMAMKAKWPERCFIDLMAGGGKCVLADRDDVLREFDGSPLLAQRCAPAFTKLVLVEAHPLLAQALTSRVGADPRVTIINQDCNSPETVERIRATVSPRALGIVFVDNLGLDVTFHTLRRLTLNRKWDLLVTFQVSALKRTELHALQHPAGRARWDAFFGTAEWLQVLQDFDAKRLSVRDVSTALKALYAKQLATIGYAHHQPLPTAMKNSRNGTLYTVELFSKNEVGKKLFKAISPRDSQGTFDGLLG